MTAIQKRAYEIIERLSDEKVYHIIKILEGIEGLSSQDGKDEKTTEQKAYESLQQFRKCSDMDVDYKAELAEALEEKYAGAD